MNNAYRENAVKRGADMRDKAMAMAMKRKEEYLGARVPKALKERVINKADEMGIPVSTLMRQLLEQSFPEDGSLSGYSEQGVSGAVGSSFSTEQKVVSQPAAKVDVVDVYAGIIAWKSIEVNQDRSCERCKEPLPRGSGASLGFTSSDGGYVIVCSSCKTQLCES